MSRWKRWTYCPSFQQEQAMMSTAEKDALATHKECLYLHQPPQQRNMPELKEHIYNSTYYVIVKK